MSSSVELFPHGRAVQLSIIVPCYNEGAVLPVFHCSIKKVLLDLPVTYELLYVNDGSDDNSACLLEALSSEAQVRCVHLSRNFGKEAAMSAGVDQAGGEAIIFIDADLQDPPELIPLMVEKWQSGYEVVNMQRSARGCDSWLKRFTARLYYALMKRLKPEFRIPMEVSDFRLLGARPLRVLRRMPERSRLIKTLVSWTGFKSIEIPYERVAREAGKTKWNYLALAGLAVDSVISVSRKPLRWFSYLALTQCVLIWGFVLTRIVYLGMDMEHGLLLSLSMIGAGIAVVGEYVGVILQETRQRPHYVIESVQGDSIHTSNSGRIEAVKEANHAS